MAGTYDLLPAEYGGPDQLRQQRPGPAFPPLSPEEEDSLLGAIGKKALGGLAYAGGVLDKTFGGRAVRGLLGGRPREALSVIPFSDTLGITDENDVVRGRDLLENAGLVDKGKPGVSLEDLPGDVGGFAADVLLDPASYLTFGAGALTKAGRAVKEIGGLPKTAAGRIAGLSSEFAMPAAARQAALDRGLAKLVPVPGVGYARDFSAITNQPLGGLVGTGGLANVLGFGGQAFGTGAAAQKVAEGLGKAADTVKYAPGVRQLRGLFDYRAGGTPVEALQRVHENTVLPELEKGLTAARGEHVGNLRAAQAGGFLDQPDLEKLVRFPAERADEVANFVGPRPAPEAAALQQGQQLSGNLNQMLDEARGLGLDVRELEGYFPRYMRQLPGVEQQAGGEPGSFFRTGNRSMIAREDILRDLPTDLVEEIVRDPRLRDPALTPLQRADVVRSSYLGNPAPAAPEYADATQRATRLADWAGSLDPRLAEQGAPGFFNSPLVDYAARRQLHERSKAAASGVHDLLAGNALPAAQGGVPVEKVLEDAGLRYNAVDAAGNVTGAKAELARRLGVPVKDLAGLTVTPDVAQAATKYLQGFTAPESVRPFVEAFDALSNLFKAGVTSPFPSFHVRNLVSGAWMNWLTGAHDPTVAGGALNPLAYVKPYQEALAIARGSTIEGAAAKYFPGAAGLSDAEATARLADEIYAHGVAGPRNLQRLEATGGQSLPLPTTVLPGSPEAVPMPSLRGMIPRTREELNPLNIAGVRGGESTFAPVREGDKAVNLVEYANRGSNYLAKRAQGFAPEEAALSSKAAQFNYEQLAPFERQVMKRLVPFYTYARKNLPFHVEQLTTEPAKLAAAFRTGTVGEQEGYVPEYLRGGIAVPVGEPQGGTQRFLSQLGLPFEEATGRFETGPHGVRRTVEQHLGQLNPLLKGPLELLAGRQFFSGRELSDLYGPTGNVGVDQLVMNSPLARAYTAGRTLVDPRKDVLTKAVNLGTGVKLTDVDVGRQRQIEGRKLLEQYLEQNPEVRKFQEFSVPKDKQAELSPDTVAMMRLERSLVEDAQVAGLRKRAEAGDAEAAQQLDALLQRRRVAIRR